MAGKQIITVAREFGSGGRQIAGLVAEKLGVPFYDKELIELAAESSGWNKQVFEELDEKKEWDVLFQLPSVAHLYGGSVAFGQLPLHDQAFLVQSKVILEVALKGSCVIVGRCADYVLREREDVVRVFIHASREQREKRIMRLYGLDEEEARKKIRAIDKERGRYYSYYTEQKWGRAHYYHLCVDSGDLGVEGTADLIAHYANTRDVQDQSFVTAATL